MVGKKLQLCISSSDAYHDVRRSRAMWLTPSEKELHELRRKLKEDDNIDESYKNVLLFLSTTYETFESPNEEKDEDEGNHDDYISGEIEPEYRKPDGESFVLDYEKEGVLVVSQYRDMCSDEECDCCDECYLGESVGAAEHGEHVRPLETDMNKRKVVLNGKVGGVTGSKRGRPRKLTGVEIVQNLRNVDRTMLNHTVIDQTDLRLTRSGTCTIGENNWRKNIPPSPPTKKASARTKSRDEAPAVKISRDEYLRLHQRVRPVTKSKKKNEKVENYLGKEVKIEQNKRKRGRPRKSHVVVQKPSREEKKRKAHKNINGINIKTEVEDESSPDSVDVYPCPKIIYRNIDRDASEKDDRSSPSNTFRKRLLSVLEKPYDREEYFKHSESFHSGKYVDYYPAVQRKLTKYKCKLPRRLTIFRGFFFWLQHLTLEGAFQPWKDHECLSTVPKPPVKPSTSKSYGASRSSNQKK